MRLKRLDIRGFGRLRGSVPLEAGDGNVALLLERNEAGKSTVTAAILASLYGLETDRRRARDRMVERDVYRPWEGGAYGLTLYLEKDGDEIAVERDFERDTVRVVRGGTDVTDAFRQGGHVAVGEGLLGLTREQFTRSVFVAQGEVVWSDTMGLTEALQRLADTRAGDTTAAAALEALDDALSSYEGVTLKGRGKVETEIDRCQTELARQRAALERLQEERQQLAAKIEALGRREQQTRQRERARAQLRHEKIRAELSSLHARLTADAERAQRADGLAEEVRRAAAVLALSPEAVHAAETAHANLQGARRAAEQCQREVDEASDRRRRAVAERAEVGLLRRPVEADRDVLHSAQVRIEDARRERERFAERLEAARNELRVQGFEPDGARELAASFGALSEEDRLTLGSRGRLDLQGSQQAEELQQEEAQLKQRRAGIREGQQTRKHSGIWLMLVGMLPIMVGLSMGRILPFSPVLLHGAGAALILVGIVVYAVGTRHRKRDDQELRRHLERLRGLLEQLAAQSKQRQESWGELAQRIGCDAAELEGRYRQWRIVVEPSLGQLEMLEQRVSEQDAIEHQALASCVKAWTLFEGEPDAEQLAEKLALVQSGFTAWAEVDSADAALKRATWQLDEQRRSVTKRQAELWAALAECGVIMPEGEPVEEGIRALKERVVEAERMREVRDRTLPEVRAGLLAEAERARREQRAGELESELARLEAETPGLAPSGVPVPPRRIEELDAELEQLAQQERAAQQAGESDRADARAFVTRYDAQAPESMRQIAELETALRRALEFREAVLLARETLERISKETHRDWAAALNRTTHDLLLALDSDVRDLRFDENLGLSMRQGQQLLTGSQAAQQLSAGALDGVYLAARLGVSRLLSGGLGPLPLILDDPFSNADDVRLLAGLRLLIGGVASRQQVILMACQAARYRWARRQLEQTPQLVELRVNDGGDATAAKRRAGD